MNRTAVYTPTEYEEQVAFRQYLDIKGLPYFHVPNSTYTKFMNQKRRNAALGVKPGVPDMFVCLPGLLIGIELKRISGGRLSDHQEFWVKTLNDSGVLTRVCRGADEAIAFVEAML